MTVGVCILRRTGGRIRQLMAAKVKTLLLYNYLGAEIVLRFEEMRKIIDKSRDI